MATQAQLNAARADDERVNRDIAKRAGPNGLQCVVDEAAVMNAVRTEGREIMTREGRGYWNDMKRIYPHLRGGRSFSTRSPNGAHNRFGRVTQRKRGANWERWNPVRGEWEVEAPNAV